MTLKEAMVVVTKEEYFEKMYAKDRMFIFLDTDNNVRGIATYAFINDPRGLKRTDLWETPEEHIGGRYIFIDRLVSDRNTHIDLKWFKAFLKKNYPGKKVLWHSRRGGNEINVNGT